MADQPASSPRGPLRRRPAPAHPFPSTGRSARNTPSSPTRGVGPSRGGKNGQQVIVQNASSAQTRSRVGMSGSSPDRLASAGSSRPSAAFDVRPRGKGRGVIVCVVAVTLLVMFATYSSWSDDGQHRIILDLVRDHDISSDSSNNWKGSRGGKHHHHAADKHVMDTTGSSLPGVGAGIGSGGGLRVLGEGGQSEQPEGQVLNSNAADRRNGRNSSAYRHNTGVAAPDSASWDYSTRFPDYGSTEYNRICKYNATYPIQTDDCSFLVRPNPNGTEGLALWVSNVVMGYCISLQRPECRLYIDYGEGVDVAAVLQPFEHRTNEGREKGFGVPWSVPPAGFECRLERDCHTIWTEPSGLSYRYSNDAHNAYAAVPFYRFAYHPRYGKLKPSDFDELGKNLAWMEGGDFNLHTAFGCAFTSLFGSSSELLKRYEPTRSFVSELLLERRDERNLVMALYVRTGSSEGKISNGAGAGYQSINDIETHIAAARETLDCAIIQEQRYLQREEILYASTAEIRSSFDKVVWIVITDSQHVKKYVNDTYGGNNVVYNDGDTDRTGIKSKSIPRRVVSTLSRGAHTRPRGAREGEGGSISAERTADFAEAMIDWLLVGESDLVLASREWSFGMTAAMRTARPVYHRVLGYNAQDGGFVNSACGRAALVY